MVDRVDAITRSRIMSGIRSKNTKPEMLVRKALHAKGFRYRLHVKDLPGKPDIVLPKYRTVVFVHGCFWHQHPGCKDAFKPQSNTEFWKKKLQGNIDRDRRAQAALALLGWRCLVIWECEVERQESISRLIAMLTRH